MGFESTASCIRGKRLTAKPQGPYDRDRIKADIEANIEIQYIESISLQRHPPETICIWIRLQKSFGIDLISQCKIKLFQLNVVKVLDALNFFN